jgi:hypothetical protein
MNWKYAVGELVLIIVGITIALAANSWFQERQNRAEEILVLQQFRETIHEDLEMLRRRGDDLRRFAADSQRLFEHLNSDQPYSPSILGYFSSFGGFRTFQFRTGPFEALRSRGFALISDENLRSRLVSLYDEQYALAESNIALDIEFVRDRVLPFMLANFRRDASDSWTPNDYEKIRHEGFLANLCRFRSSSLERYTLPSLDRTEANILEVMSLIDDDIGSTN